MWGRGLAPSLASHQEVTSNRVAKQDIVKMFCGSICYRVTAQGSCLTNSTNPWDNCEQLTFETETNYKP